MTKNLNKLVTLLSLTDGINGRKKIQKIVFILKQLKSTFNESFIYHHFGPYSSELQLELDFLVSNNIIKEIGENPYRYSINDIENFSDIDLSVSESKDLLLVLNNLSANFLEVLSTIFYLYEMETNDLEIIKKKLSYLKPKLSSEFDDAIEYFKKLTIEHKKEINTLSFDFS